MGVIAFVVGFVPVVGDVGAAPTAVLAVALGFVGVRRYETGRAAHVVPAVAGAGLGGLAIMASVLVFVATQVSP